MDELEVRSGVCVYAHCVGEQVIYIGMGTLERAFKVTFRPKKWQEIVAGGYRVKVLGWFDNRRLAAVAERQLIERFSPPCNLLHSKNYISPHVGNKYAEGRVWSQESRDKLSKAQKESWLKTKRSVGRRRPTKPIKCIDSGIVYDGLREAARKTGAHYTSISACINGLRGTANGLRFVRLEG